MRGNFDDEASGSRLSNAETQLPYEDNRIELDELPGASTRPLPPLIDPYTRRTIVAASSAANSLPQADRLQPAPGTPDPWRQSRMAASLPPLSSAHTYDAAPPPYRQVTSAPWTMEVREDAGLQPAALVAGAAAAIAGAAAWAMIAAQSGADAPWMAAAIGCVVGLASHFAGGRGYRMGFISAGFALVSAIAARQLTLQFLSQTPPATAYYGFLGIAIFLAFFLGGTRR